MVLVFKHLLHCQMLEVLFFFSTRVRFEKTSRKNILSKSSIKAWVLISVCLSAKLLGGLQEKSHGPFKVNGGFGICQDSKIRRILLLFKQYIFY